MKLCIRCDFKKPLTEFYKHPAMGDGLLSVCKECVKKRVKKRSDNLKKDKSWREKEKARGREKYQRLYKGLKPNHDVRKKSSILYKKRYPEKQKAKQFAYKLPCPPGFHRHHWSYRKEHYLDIIVIPIKLHYKIHRYMKYIPSKKMYSTFQGVLLDTHAKHLSFIEAIKLIPE